MSAGCSGKSTAAVIFHLKSQPAGATDGRWLTLAPAQPVCRPKFGQREVYNGHKRKHVIKFQSIVLCNGMLCSVLGPFAGKDHDARMYRVGGTRQAIINNMHGGVLYADKAYPRSAQCQKGFPGRHAPGTLQHGFNKAMNRLRTSVEWPFGKLTYLPQGAPPPSAAAATPPLPAHPHARTPQRPPPCIPRQGT